MPVKKKTVKALRLRPGRVWKSFRNEATLIIGKQCSQEQADAMNGYEGDIVDLPVPEPERAVAGASETR